MKPNRRFIRRRMLPAAGLFLALVICTTMLTGVTLSAHPAQVHVKILVVVCEYADTETPELKSQQWADELNLGINSLYTTATHQQAPEFEFIPVPGVLKLDVDYSPSVFIGEHVSTLVDDPGVIDREGVMALRYARQMLPEHFSEPVYLLAVVNRIKGRRARGLFDFPLISANQKEMKVRASIAVLSDPLASARFELGSSETEPGTADSDGDGLSDEEESRLGTLPDRMDSDGDGYSDWAEVALGISDPLNTISKLSLPDKSISSVAHLVGHQIGLLGLHQDERYVKEDSFGYWGLMARDNSQGLSGFTRFHSKWYDTRFGELLIDIGPNGWDEPLFYLAEPSLQFIGQFLPPGVFEIVRIRRPSLPDVLLEARPKFSVDASRVAEGFSGLGDMAGLPSDYQSGVLVSQIDPGYDGQTFPRPGQYGVSVARVLPHQKGEGSTSGNEGERIVLQNAAIQEQQVFRDAYGLQISVGAFDPFEGSYEVAVHSDPIPSFPDLSIVAAWLDSSANGYDTFTFGRDENSGAPLLGGDPVHLIRHPVFHWTDSKPELEIRASSPEHRVTFQLKNGGTSDAINVEGTLYVLSGLTLPVGDSMFDSAVLDSMSLAQQGVFVESLKPGEMTEISMAFYPDGPVQSILLLEPSLDEQMTHNNRHRAVFWTEYAALNTVYPVIEQTVQIFNGTPFHHHLAAQVSGVSSEGKGWLSDSETLESKWSIPVQSGESGSFQFHFTPPLSEDATPGAVEQVSVDTWMDYGDTDVPAGDLPLSVVLSMPVTLSIDLLEKSGETLIAGHLSSVAAGLDHVREGVIAVEVAGSDGSHQSILTTTSEEGEFHVKVDVRPMTRYAALANFIGDETSAPSSSNLIQWGQVGNPPAGPLRITSIHLNENRQVCLTITNTQPGSIFMQLVQSGDLVIWREVDRMEIPTGEFEWKFPYEPEQGAVFFKMVIVER